MVLQLLSQAEVRRHVILVAYDKGAVAARLVVLYRRLTINQVAQQQQEGHREAQPCNINHGKQPVTAQEFQITLHTSLHYDLLLFKIRFRAGAPVYEAVRSKI